jgi:hypothetical protein
VTAQVHTYDNRTRRAGATLGGAIPSFRRVRATGLLAWSRGRRSRRLRQDVHAWLCAVCDIWDEGDDDEGDDDERDDLARVAHEAC